MRILLVRPMTETKYMQALYPVAKVEPLALEYIGAGVKEHNVKILDMRLENGNEGLQQTLEDFRPDIVGTTSLTAEVNAAKRVHARTKEFDSRILTVAGGMHATVAPQDFVDDCTDVIVIGEGTFTFREIVEHFEQGRDFMDIKGIGLPVNGQLLRTESRPWPALDDLPMPDRSLTAHIRHRYSLNIWSKDIAVMRTTVGCPYKCDYCICWVLAGGRYMKRDVESVIQEMKAIEESYLFITDDEFFIDTERAKRIAQRIKEEGINKHYFLFARSDSICSHPELFKIWKEIGLSEVFVGVEAVTDSGLDDWHKTVRMTQNDQAMKIVRELGIDCLCALMVRPDFAKEDFERMYDYCMRMDLVCPQFNVMTPFPGTVLYEQVKDQFVFHDLDLFDFSHAVLPTKLDLEEFYAEFAKLYMYHRESAPLDYHVRKLGTLSPEEMQESIGKIEALQEAISTLHVDHEPTPVASDVGVF